MTSDLIDFVRQHRALTALFAIYNFAAVLALSMNGLASFAVLLVLILAFIWFCVLAGLSILRSYETSRAGHGEPRLAKPRHRMARRGMAGRGVASQGTARRGKEPDDQ